MTTKHLHLMIAFAALISVLFSCAGTSYAAAVVPAGFQINTIVSGLNLPTSFTFAPDGRMFITEKSGTVRIFKNGQLLSTPVIRLPDLNDFGDRGLESIALDPDFSHNGYMYVAYTYENTPGQNYTGPKTGRIVRFTVVGDTADFNSRVVILGTVGGDAAHPSCSTFAITNDCILSDASTHSMGDMHFGPDGKLYASLGDGAGYTGVDPLALFALDTRALAGKIVRINTDGTGVSDNPFYTGNAHDNQSKIWTSGHRNSYRFSFRSTDGKLFFGEVGWSTWEEIDIGVKGADYGWPCREGYVATAYNCTPPTSWTDPIYVFDHTTGTASVIGGIFPAAGVYPAQYTGNYFFGDYSNDRIKRMVLNGDDTVASVEDFITGAGGPVDFVPGLDGTIYYSSINTGQIRQIAFSNANRPPVARVSANPMTGVPPFSVHFSGANSSDPDNDQITYRWDFGDGSTVSTAVSPDHVYSSLGTYTATLTVTDSHGAVGTATAGIIVTNTPVINALPHVTQTVQSPVPPNAVGRDVLVTSTITNSGAASPFIIDFEIYNTSGQLAAQKIYNGQTIPTGGHADYAIDWFPGTVGDYTVKVALFKAGWVGMYEWNDQALLLHIVDRAATESSFAHQGTTLSPASPAVGNADLITSTITNTGGAGSALVDMEVYKDGIKVGQKFFNDQVFAAGQSRDFSYSFTPLAAGTYTVSIGVFKPGWTGIYAWFDQVAAFSTMSADQSVSIYQDALAPGWYNWSWGSTQDFSDTSLVFAGTNAMRVAYDAPWGGLFLHHAGINTSGKRALSFVIAGSGGGGQNLQIYTFDSNGVQSSVKNLSAYVPDGTIIANTWKQVSIPLADIGADNKAISGIIVQSAGAASARVDIDAMQIQ